MGAMVCQARLFSSVDRALCRYSGDAPPSLLNAARLGNSSQVASSAELPATILPFHDQKGWLCHGTAAKTHLIAWIELEFSSKEREAGHLPGSTQVPHRQSRRVNEVLDRP
jgi:hypothetical protein